MSAPKNSGHSVSNASQSKDTYSGHGDAQGAAGVVEGDIAIQDMLDKSGESEIITPPEGGFDNMKIGLAWNNIIVEQSSGFMGLIKKATKQGVDLDLGCFFELQDETKGILQPFGELFGNLEEMPYIALSGDDRTGNADGYDEYLTINGPQWPKIKRVLVYTYIYKGSSDWSQIQPDLGVMIEKNKPALHIKPALKTNKMTVCALATLKNAKNGVQIMTHGEYFTSQASMDRAFGFGFNWEDGAKD